MPDEAHRVLEEIKLPEKADEDEARWVEADRRLMLTFLAENEARRDKARWPAALEAGKRLFASDMAGLPPRVDAERHLHLGIAQTFTLPDERTTSDLLNQARAIATKTQMQRMKVAACLAIVEHGLERGAQWFDLKEAWLEADVLLESMSSSFLAEWRARLTARVAPDDYFVRVPVVSKFKSAREQFEAAYVRYHWERSLHNIEEFMKNTGLQKAQAYRVTDDLRPKSAPKRSRPPKQAAN